MAGMEGVDVEHNIEQEPPHGRLLSSCVPGGRLSPTKTRGEHWTVLRLHRFVNDADCTTKFGSITALPKPISEVIEQAYGSHEARRSASRLLPNRRHMAP